MRIDLHVHSSASDGVFSPAEVVRKAHANGVEVMALTDHDTVSGLKEARKEAEKLGMRFIDGVELSVSWGGRTIHVVSLGPKKFEPYRELSEKLSKQRDLRARTIASKFDAMGIYNTYEQALELAGNGLNLSRRHFALALVQRGTVGTEDEAFEKYLRDEGPAFVKTQWMTLPEAMRFIRETEGVAVMAHPGRYNFVAPVTTIDLLEEFKALGGDAIEVTTGSHFEAENERYTRVALNMGFLASTGSDFHGCKPGRPEPGLQEPLPDYLPTVLDLLKDR
jgi:S-adenosylmethionine:tRNA ribosyltransferase-isomerase